VRPPLRPGTQTTTDGRAGGTAIETINNLRTVKNGYLTSAQVAELLGVTAGTVKRWTRAGLLACARTAGGHRRFDPREVARLRTPATAEVDGTAPWLEALFAPGERTFDAALAAERAHTGAWWRVAETLGPVIHALGRRCERGELDVLDEHAASERLARALARAAESLRASTSAPRAVLAAAAGEEHTLGLGLVELCLRERGWRTIWAGRRTPTGALADAILSPRRRFDAVVVSASACAAAARLETQQATLARVCRAARIPLLVGGQGPWRPSVPGCRVERDFRGLLDWAVEVERALDAAPLAARH
jgi:MerR family transcriptional regulator, light-induced transcriptional regulator